MTTHWYRCPLYSWQTLHTPRCPTHSCHTSQTPPWSHCPWTHTRTCPSPAWTTWTTLARYHSGQNMPRPSWRSSTRLSCPKISLWSFNTQSLIATWVFTGRRSLGVLWGSTCRLKCFVSTMYMSNNYCLSLLRDAEVQLCVVVDEGLFWDHAVFWFAYHSSHEDYACLLWWPYSGHDFWVLVGVK